MRRIQRILVVRQENKLGDVLMSTPVFAALKKALPGCHVTAMVQRHQHHVLQHNPDVDELWHTEYKPRIRQAPFLVRQLRRGQFDAVALLRPNSGMHTFLSWMAGIPVRAGSSTKYYARLLTHNWGKDLWEDPCMHWIAASLRVAGAAVGVVLEPLPIKLIIPADAVAKAWDLLCSEGITNYFCIHPGTGGSSHAWYPEKYGQVASMLCRETGWRAVVTATRSELDLADIVCTKAGTHCVNLGGKTDLPTLAAVLKGAKLLISGDTGVVHVAASVHTPCVVVHTGADYEKRTLLFHPWMTPYRVAHPHRYCAGCSEHECSHKGEECLQSISVDEVVQAAIVLSEERA